VRSSGVSRQKTRQVSLGTSPSSASPASFRASPAAWAAAPGARRAPPPAPPACPGPAPPTARCAPTGPRGRVLQWGGPRRCWALLRRWVWGRSLGSERAGRRPGCLQSASSMKRGRSPGGRSSPGQGKGSGEGDGQLQGWLGVVLCNAVVRELFGVQHCLAHVAGNYQVTRGHSPERNHSPRIET